MANRYYECERCGMIFRPDDARNEPQCPVCSSRAVVDVEKEQVTVWSCAPRGGYS